MDAQPSGVPPADLSSYESFLHRMEEATKTGPLSSKDLLQRIDVSHSQLHAWLKRGVAEGHVKKLQEPVRYCWQEIEPKQRSMFD